MNEAPDAAPTLPLRTLALLAGASDSDDGWLLALRAWMLKGSKPERHAERLRAITGALESDPALCSQVAAATAALFGSASALSFFTEVGLPSRPNFFSEAIDRVSRRFLPAAPFTLELAAMFGRLVPSAKVARSIAALPADDLAALLALLDGPEAKPRLELDLAIDVLRIRVAGIGLDGLVSARLLEAGIDPTPFRSLAGAQAGAADLGDCRAALELLGERLEGLAVSVTLVYRLEQLERGLDRLERLLSLRDAPGLAAGLDFVVELTEQADLERSVRGLGRRNLRLLSRRIAEHSGETGSHYITSTRGEWREMLARASGGGVLTAGTAVGKYAVAGFGLALLPDAILTAIVYAGSFLLMQALGFTLATKQPSVTAAAFAAALRDGRTGALVALAQRITRSQFAAAIGNIGAVIPIAVAIHFVWQELAGKPVLDEATARYLVGSLHPFASGTIVFAALTGVLLWFSSVLAGAANNWALLRRFPEGIGASPRVRALVGRRGAAWLGDRLRSGIAGIAGNTSLGVLLAFVPFAGKMFGLPLDVRHVTLSTGALALAACTLGASSIATVEFALASLGILIIATLNFGVSFALALRVAIRAQGMQRDRSRLTRGLLTRFLRQPLSFLLPPAAAAPPAEDAAPVLEEASVVEEASAPEETIVDPDPGPAPG